MASKATTTSTKFEVEKFDGKVNFLLWKMRVTSLLVKEWTYQALQGIRKKPSTMGEDDWKEIDIKAKATIILCLSDEVLYNVMNEETAAGMWNRLESLYMTKSLSNKLYVKKQLYCLRMVEGTPILQHLNVFNKILNDLLALEVKMEEEDKALILLSSLPPSYDHLVTTILYGKETLELEDVRVMLVNNELMKRTDPAQEGSGLVVGSGKGKGPKREKKSSFKVSCWICKGGHTRRECPFREEVSKMTGRGSDRGEKSGKPEASVVEEDLCEVLMAQSGRKKTSDVWLLDSACTYHVCPRREWFSTYQPCDGGSILMGNDAECKVVGIRSIRMRMFDGEVRTVANVRHVLEVSNNLLSLGALEARGCRFASAKGILKVRKGSRLVLKGERFANLYLVKGSVVVGDALPVTKKIDGGKATSMKECLGRHGTLSTQEKPKHKGVEIRMKRTPEACPEYQKKADMSHSDWAPEVNHACFIKSPQSVVGLHTPGDLWREEAADYSALQFSCSRLSYNVNSQEMDKLEKRPRAIGLTTEVRKGSPVTRSAFTNYVLDDRALLRGSMKTRVEAHCGAHICLADSLEGDKLSVVADTTGESLVS